MTKLTLAIVTSTPQVSVALGRGPELVASLVVRQGRRHAEVLAPAVESCVRLAGARLAEVEQIAVDVGPGLFTGLRVGVTTAKALASALDIPVVACSSLDLLAHPHRRDGGLVASVVDARRAEVFWALYRPGGVGMVAMTEPAVAEPAELVAALAASPDPVKLTGDGARRYADLFNGSVLASPEHDHPVAGYLLELAASRPALHPDKVTPIYIRGADVRIGWEQRDG